MKILNEGSFKKGFTLAEMLIVLAVIGIVAAITITIVFANSQKTQFVSALQKASNIFTNVANRSQVSGEGIDTWDYSLSVGEFADRYFSSYFNIIKNCGTKEDGCFGERYTYADGSDATSDTTGSEIYKFILTDGISIGMKIESAEEASCAEGNICARFIVDVNGPTRPNIWGKDVFEYRILGNLNTIVPAGSFTNDASSGKLTYNEPDAIDNDCKTKGTFCAAKIINDGWEMKY